MQVSCIIPTRNRCRMVLQALDSIARQQWNDHEVIVVDDGSSDNTCQEISARYPDVQLIRLDGVGPGMARNAGADAAQGNCLMFLDSDDQWLDGHVVMLMEVLNRGFEVAYGVTKTVDEVNGGDFLIPDNGMGIEGDCFKNILRWCFLIPSSIAVNRDIYEEIGGFGDQQYGEDWIFFIRLAARFPFGFAGSSPITLRRLHKGSLCNTNDRKKFLAIIRQVLTLLESEPRTTSEDLLHFRNLEQWTANHTAQWSTVQEWYQSMRQENII